MKLPKACFLYRPFRIPVCPIPTKMAIIGDMSGMPTKTAVIEDTGIGNTGRYVVSYNRRPL